MLVGRTFLRGRDQRPCRYGRQRVQCSEEDPHLSAENRPSTFLVLIEDPNTSLGQRDEEKSHLQGYADRRP
jgi:hypothetical protein